MAGAPRASIRSARAQGGRGALCGCRLCEKFDLIYGTSTGAIIASLLGLGESADDIESLYRLRVVSVMGEVLPHKKTAALERLRDAPPDIPDVIPNIAEIYRRKVTDVAAALADPEKGTRAASMVRSLIGEIVLTPGTGRGALDAVLRGELCWQSSTSPAAKPKPSGPMQEL